MIGKVVCDLGNTYLHVGGRNGSALFDLIAPHKVPVVYVLYSSCCFNDLASRSPEGVTVAQLRAAARNIREQLVLLDDRAQKPNADSLVYSSLNLVL